MKRINYDSEKKELTISISVEEQCEIQQAIYHYNEYLKDILSRYEKGELKSVEEDVEILSRLYKGL